ncbi:hypothetical protein A9P82_06565 [Arachidicoccus ginsenosidimutans]|uniref:hypothetical protein n=1 Tax=Arachidicoccus sp. BS20 TaxID=1850526 RepID=UPI0007F08EC2|nr:hypothetical protein [Arachidicoccus sp. BS20]ANI88985.1 hypothetical protein A9P82_06565 [Arachidicoccus sp. BS20]
MATVTLTKLYAILEDKIGRQQAEALTTYVDEKIKEEAIESTKEIATKDYVRAEIENVRVEIHKSTATLQQWFIGVIIALVLSFIGLYLKK